MGKGARRKGDQGFAYLNSSGAVRLARAYAGVAERAPKYALVRLAEALVGKQG